MNWYRDVIRESAAFNATSRVATLTLLHPTFRRKVEAVITDALGVGVRLIAFETYRSQARQTELYKQKVTELRTVGVHHYGLAADLVPLDSRGVPTWDDPEAFRLLQHLAHVHGLVSGIDWGHPERHHTFVDEPHVQMCSIEQQDALFRGEWYPPVE